MIMAALILTVSPLAPAMPVDSGPPEPWSTLADCESGDWLDGGAEFIEGSARWNWGSPDMNVPKWGTDNFHGGLQFHPNTWTWLKPDHFPEYAYEATVEQQIAVARRVFEAQGWEAWPVCSRKIGLRP